jgi:ubiquinone/menaquinone biosynthesis C-methylase UbiE
LLTVDFTKFTVNPGDRVLDLGCGAGRHAFEAYRRGARVVAADLDVRELPPVCDMFAAMREAGETGTTAAAGAVSADATRLPFPDGAFDAIIAAEILEHVPDDTAALAEIARVLRPGGTVAVTVPAWLPERICWALSREYHEVPGGHVRIFTSAELSAKLAAAGLTPTGGHHAHGLHSAYWWLKCAVGVHDDAHPAVRAYHRLLVWDIMSKPALTRLSEAALNPLIGKSLVIYARKAQPGKPVTPNGFAGPVTRTHSPHGDAGGFAGGVSPGKQGDLAGSGAAE